MTLGEAEHWRNEANRISAEALRRNDVLESAIEALRDIASLQGSKTARRKVKEAGCDIAAHWLAQHGYPLEDGGYIPGKGFSVVGDVESGRQPVRPDVLPVDDAGAVTRTSLANQCDGCFAGYPLRNDIHYATYANGAEYPYCYCSADRYV